jgi:TolB protein
MSRPAAALALLVAMAGAGAASFRGDRGPALSRLTDDGLEKERPAWSPDGTRLLVARHEADGSHIRLYLLERDRPPRRLTDRTPPVEYHGAWTPDGATILFAAISLSGTQGNVDIAAISPDGKGFEVRVGDRGGKLAHQDWPSPSPDGSRFAFSSTHEGNQEIYTAKSDGTDLVRVTQSPGHEAHPCWSADGRILFATDRWGGLELAAAAPDGSKVERLTASPGLDDYPAASPDGKSVVFVSNRDGQYELYRAAADGTGATNLTRHPARDTHPCWTPDGKAITFVSDRDSRVELYTRAVE